MKKGVDVNASSKKCYYTPIFRAVAYCDLAKVKLLIDHGANAKIHDSTFMTPLHTAKANVSSDIARLLIKAGSCIDGYDNGGMTPLHHAAQYSSVRVVEELLRHGADPNLSSRHYKPTQQDGKTALFYAVDPNCHKPRNSETILQLILWHGANINKIDNQGLTALYLAAKNGSISQAQMLLNHGAHINPQATSNALHAAALARQMEMIIWLLTQGSDVNHRDHGNETPIFNAIQSFVPLPRASDRTFMSVRDAPHVDDSCIVQRLLSAGANINYKNTQGMTPLSVAADLGYTKIMRMLIERDADVHTKDNQRQTPLHKATRGNPLHWHDFSLEATNVLIEHGANPNARDIDGYSPVHTAAQGQLSSRAQETLRVLTCAGGDIHARSHNGNSPKDMVICYGEDEVRASEFFAEFEA